MTKRNFFKRITAGFLAALFVLALIPPVEARANPQNPVEGFEISSATGVGRNYTLSMFWTRPLPPTPTMPPANYTGTWDTWNNHSPNYEIMRFNATNAAIPAGWGGWEQQGANIASGASVVTQSIAQNLMPGQFWAYQIRAWHSHLMNNPAGTIPPQVWQRVEGPANPDNAVYFMTDLEVEATGRGRDLTITWTRPQFGGTDPFDSYRIYYQLRAGGTLHHVDVPTAALEVVDGRYQFIIENADGLVAGRVFTVRVEPRIGSDTRFTPSSTSQSGLTDAFAANNNEKRLTHTMNHFTADNVFIQPVLSGSPVGMNYLLLYWGAPEGATHVRLQQQGVGGGWTDIAIFDAPAAGNLDYLLINRPDVATNFRIIFYIDGERQEPPEEWTFDPALAQFMPTRPNIIETQTAEGPPLGITVTWEAFMRRPFNAGEGAPNTWFLDPDIVYDIWITDNAAAFQGNVPTITPLVEGMTQDQINTFLAADNAWRHTFNQFRTIDDILAPIAANRVYYIRIVARRTVPYEQQSVAAYASHFIFGEAVVTPPVMPRPPLRVENEGLDYLELAWENCWVEAFEVITDTSDPNWPGIWHSAFGLRNGTLVFDDDVVAPNRVTINPGVTALHPLGDEAAIRAALGSNQVPLRTQRLPHPATIYQVHIRPLSEIITQIEPPTGDLEAFMYALHHGGGPWQTVTLQTDGEAGGCPITLTTTLEGLEPDTTYAIFFRPVNAAGQAWWPTLIMGTTGNERPDLDITPPAAFLAPYEEGDRWLEFTMRPFSADGSVTYEFWISEFVDRETAWEFEPNTDRSRMFTYPGGGTSLQRRIFHADGLFPETTYYIWVRSIASGSENYAWSAPISMTTLPLMQPPPPSGLGLAGPSEVNVINLENELELSRVGSDHMVIAWSPIRGFPGMPDDVHLPLEGIEDGAMGTTILGSPMINFAYMVLFPDLTPNTAYWVRAATILSVHRDGIGGEITERVDFVVQFATNPDFLDAITVYAMPDAEDIRHGLHTRMNTSEWAGPMMFWTSRDDGEFDGDVIAELFPLPSRDFEIIYNHATQTLTWRFRSTGVGADGHRDNLVDQRFISRLIQQRVFEYTIDMTHYNHLPVRNRVVELPYSIITAFDQRGIDFRVIAGNTTYTFSSGFAQTPQNVGFGVPSRLRMYINDAPEPPGLGVGRHYLTTPQSVSVSVANPHSTINLTALATPVTATHSINRTAVMDYNIGAYVRSGGDVDWRRQGSGLDEIAGTISTSTTRPATFAAIATGIPQPFEATPGERDAMYFVNTQITFTDMEWFVPEFAVDAWQINRIIAAIATGATHAPINMLDPLTEQEMHSLTNGRMLVPGGATVAREDALAALVRLYEVRTGRRVAGAPTLQSTSFADIATATPQLQQAMLNAEALGFISGTTANPHGEMLWGDTVLILEIILRN
ncbi:MAG: fibronectin type III domain-containing protein [Defluviitaleaceae bacterium]|nr:fibronectin type III domain-containing protein [Defluviitaleaceae bacterium]